MNLTTTIRAAAGALLLAGGQLAHAHAYPTHQVPSAGETVTASPKTVAIDFDDALEPAFSSIAVNDAHGHAVTSGKVEVDASNRQHMSVALNPLTPGIYAVAWVAVAVDGHRTHGHYAFIVKRQWTHSLTRRCDRRHGPVAVPRAYRRSRQPRSARSPVSRPAHSLSCSSRGSTTCYRIRRKPARRCLT